MKNILTKRTLLLTVTAGAALLHLATSALAAPGALDRTFGLTGKVTTSLGSYGHAIAVQSDGRIIVIFSLAFQSDGKIVVGGSTTDAGGNVDVAVARYGAAGALDPTFGSAGKVTTRVGNPGAVARSVAVRSDGKILVAGSSSPADFMLLRYLSNGTLDPIFGNGGKQVTPIGAGDDEAYAMALQSDGKVVLAGRSYNGANNDLGVARYLGFAPNLVLEQPAGTPVSGSISFDPVQSLQPSLPKTFTIRNTGDADLTGIAASLSPFLGTAAQEFSANTFGLNATLLPGASTTFEVVSAPQAPTGARAATLAIASNDEANNPRTVILTGFTYSATQDSDGDGLNDWGEYKLSDLGFNYLTSQPALVNTLYSNASAARLYTQTQMDGNRQAGRNDVTGNPNAYSLYTLTQVQALNVGTPLLTRDAASGKFKLKLALKKSANLTDYQPFPFTDPGTAINTQGEVEFEFTAPGNAAFFRVEAR